jgi:hypothetical protein
MSTAAIAGVAAAALLGLVRYYRRSSTQMLDAYCIRVDDLPMDDIAAMVPACIQEFRERLGIRLDLNDLEGAAWTLDQALRSQRTVMVLSAPGHPLRALELAGAFIGELVRRHGRGEWILGGRSPGVRVSRSDGDREILPFVDALNQFKAGHEGDLFALILFAAGHAGAELPAGHWAEQRKPLD